ncbi:MAG: hypothetical protein K6A35_07715 [bacterium]|nr:hypothetical protein [bacterium]
MLANEGVILEYKAATGEVLTYKTVADVIQTKNEAGQEFNGPNSRIEMVIEQRVTKVSGQNIDLDLCITDGSVDNGEQKTPLGTVGQVIKTTIDRSGRTLKSSLDNNMKQPSFPSGLVKIGTTWQETNPLSVPIGDSGQTTQANMEFTFKLVGLEHAQNYEVAVIESTAPAVSINIGEGVTETIRAEGRTLFAHNAGRLVSSHVVTNIMIAAENLELKLDLTTDMELIKVNSPIMEEATPMAEESFIIGM